VAQQAHLGNLAYPRAKLPDNAAQIPLEVKLSPQGGFDLQPDPAHPTNPLLQEAGGGFVLSVCNMSSTAHTVGRGDGPPRGCDPLQWAAQPVEYLPGTLCPALRSRRKRLWWRGPPERVSARPLRSRGDHWHGGDDDTDRHQHLRSQRQPDLWTAARHAQARRADEH